MIVFVLGEEFVAQLPIKHSNACELNKTNFVNTGGPRNSRTFYLQIRLFTLVKVVQNEGTYLPRISRETCIVYVSEIFDKE